MAASATPRPTPASSDNPAARALAALDAPLPAAVAFSGGADSSALLYAAARRWPGQVQAIHVHHGLQAPADAFERQCRATCGALSVPLQVIAVDARHRPGESPEDAARKARYAALAQAAAGRGLRSVLLAQHADDQVETMLLALSRGAGLPGLAAMPARFERHGMLFLRPLLAVPGAALRTWLAREQIACIEDPMNADPAYTRSRIRHTVLPALAQAFPRFRETFARSAAHAAQAQELLAEVAAADLAAVGDPPAVAALRRLSRGRQANLLRHWLRSAHGAVGSAAQLNELLDQLAACTTRGHGIRIKVAAGRVELCNGNLRYVTSTAD
ncbi:tRNA lysidine(34) synthetase TilS [Ramlibacter sp.]|uniref:tRNA lysidine(34) synthetase TilS n=1 Tax=Ramlibacter sp. TaxID=1917967 RepID=UPI002CBAA9CD|nr:tRNA lysidine(34) synthetase TilS [Ramlibacter sp.]HWI83209.1 tRNA lysidine(34) synthetase TilS [Ramlibacter sp.]